MGNTGILLLIQVLLIALNAIFASAEIAVLSLSEAKLSKLASQGNKRAKRLHRLTSQPAKFLATIQVAITLSGFLGSAFAAENFSDGIVEWLIGLGVTIPRSTLDTIAVMVITLILSYFTLVFGELVPKRVAMRKSEQLALGISGLIGGISVAFKPLVWLLSVSTNCILRLIGIDPNQDDEEVSEEEIRMMVDAGSQQGTIDHEEKRLIQNVFEFDDLTAGEIATHRTELTILWMEDSSQEWEKIIYDTNFSRYPVCQDSPDQIVGILNSKVYLRLADRSRDSVLKHALEPAYFVPESVKADVLFRNMKKERKNMSIVLDEYGGMVGLVTVNDLVRELVGDFDVESTPPVSELEQSTWHIHGNLPLRDIEEVTGLHLDTGEFDTLNGLILDAVGSVPEDGSHSIQLQMDGYEILIHRVEDHQVTEATIRLLPPAEESQEEK